MFSLNFAVGAVVVTAVAASALLGGVRPRRASSRIACGESSEHLERGPRFSQETPSDPCPRLLGLGLGGPLARGGSGSGAHETARRLGLGGPLVPLVPKRRSALQTASTPPSTQKVERSRPKVERSTPTPGPGPQVERPAQCAKPATVDSQPRT